MLWFFSVPYLQASAWFAKCCSMTRLPILWLANQQVTIIALLSNLPGGLTSWGAMWQHKWYQHWPTTEASLCRLHLHAANTWYLVMWFCWCLYAYSCASSRALFLFLFSLMFLLTLCVRSCDPPFSSSYVCLSFFSCYIWLTQSSLALIATRNEKRSHVLTNIFCVCLEHIPNCPNQVEHWTSWWPQREATPAVGVQRLTAWSCWSSRPTGLQIICTAYQIYKQFPNNEHAWTCNNHYNSVHEFYKPSLDIFRGQLWPTQVNFKTAPKMGPLAATHKHSRSPGQKIILSFTKQHRRSRSISLVVPRFEPQINRS